MKITDKMRLDYLAIYGMGSLKWELWDGADGYYSAFRKAIDAAILSDHRRKPSPPKVRR